MSFSFNNRYDDYGFETNSSRRARNAPGPDHNRTMQSIRETHVPETYSYAAWRRRRRQFGVPLGDWLSSPTGLYATGRISRTSNPYRPNRQHQMTSSIYNPSSYNPNDWVSASEYNPLPHASHDHAMMSRSARYRANSNTRSGYWHNQNRIGRRAYEVVRQNVGQALNPRTSRDYEGALAYRDYQRGVIISRLRGG